MKRVNLTNYHSHCSFCDGRAPLEYFVKEAVRQGFSAYGVSSHAPLPFATRWTLDRSDVQAYLAEIARLKELYADSIELYAGLEIDYLDESSNPSVDFFQQLPLDYRIGSVHLLRSSEGEIVDIDVHKERFKELLPEYFENDVRALVEQYYATLTRMIELGGFDILGHADKMSYNASYCLPGLLDLPWYQELIHAYFELIASKNLMVEINTKAYNDMNVLFPNQRYFPLFKQLHIPVVVNSDAHYPDRINAGRMEALQILKEAGIQEVMELHQAKWQAVPIG